MDTNDNILIPMSTEEISHTFQALKFEYSNYSEQYSQPFFKEFSNLYNVDTILLRCICDDKKLFSQCIQNLPFRWNLGSSHLYLDNSIIKGLLNNKFLNESPSPIREFTDGANWEHFEKIGIERISPFAFEGRLAEVVAKGGLFFKSKESLKNILKLAREFSDSIIQRRLNSFTIYHLEEGWSAYHGNMGYDNTFILFDQDLGEFWILANADYD